MLNGITTIFNLEIFQIFIYVYAYLKYGETEKRNTKTQETQKVRNAFRKTFFCILHIFLTPIISLIIILIFIILATYYEIINIVLKVKHWKNYFGMLSGTDAVWICGEDQSRSVMNALMIIQIKEEETAQDLLSMLSEQFKIISDTHPKVTCVRAREFGYGYLLKTELDIKDYVVFMEDYANMDELNVLFDKYGNAALPINDTGMWRVYVGKTPIKWGPKRRERVYPVLTVYHHSVGDAVALITLITVNLFQNGTEVMKEGCKKMQENLKIRNKRNSKPLVQNVFNNIKYILTRPYYFKYLGAFTPPQVNKLHGPELLGDKHLVYSLEPEGFGYLNKVKAIKKRFPGTSFNDVIVTAVSASFAEFFHQHENPPEMIRTLVTAFIRTADFNHLVKLKDDKYITNLENNITMGSMYMPIADENIEKNLVDRLLKISEDSKKLREALDFQFVYWRFKKLQIIPLKTATNMFKVPDHTVLVSNLPGGPKYKLNSGNEIIDNIAWAPNFGKMGCSIVIFSYDGMFRIAINMDKGLMENRKDVQLLGDRVFYYIDLLNDLTSHMQNIDIVIK